MTKFLRRIMFCLLGLSAALLAWGGLELILLAGGSLGGYFLLTLLEGLLLGAVFGFVFGSADGILLSDRSRALAGGLSGLLIGVLAGALVTLLVQGLLTAFFNAELFSRKTETSMIMPLVKGLGWSVLGAVIGAIDGIRTGSARRAGIGIAGGAIGGLLGGMVLELAGRFVENGLTARGAGLLLMGICIGLFYSLFESWRSFGILKVLTGAIRGKEYLIVARKTYLGLGRKSSIALKDYKGISREHLILQAGKDGITAQAMEGRVFVNEKPINKKLLRYEDVIEAGGVKLIFLPVR